MSVRNFTKRMAAIPKVIVQRTRLRPRAFKCHSPTAALAAAAKLFELGRLSSGAAAKLAGVPVPVFLGKLADYGVSVLQMNEAELREDAQRA